MDVITYTNARKNLAKTMEKVCQDHSPVVITREKTDKKILRRINTFIKETKRNPFGGIGKSEPLKHALYNYWYRRINDEHRFVYKVNQDSINISLFLGIILSVYSFIPNS